jgi:hypothetical protein
VLLLKKEKRTYVYVKPLHAGTERAVELQTLSRNLEERFLFSPVQYTVSMPTASRGRESVMRACRHFHSEMSDACYINLAVKLYPSPSPSSSVKLNVGNLMHVVIAELSVRMFSQLRMKEFL